MDSLNHRVSYGKGRYGTHTDGSDGMRENGYRETCSALKQAYRDILGVEQERVRTVYLKGSSPLLRKRIEERQHPYMDKNLLRSQLDTLEEPKDGLRVDISETPGTIVSTILQNLKLDQ